QLRRHRLVHDGDRGGDRRDGRLCGSAPGISGQAAVDWCDVADFDVSGDLVTPLFNIERRIGLFDTWPGLIIPYIAFALPLAIYTLSAFFREIPWDLEKAAKMDGATAGQAFRKVIAPLAAPGIVTAAILVFIFAWNDLLLALSLTATKAAITAPVAIANFTGSSQFEEPTGSIAAGAMVITVPIIVFVLVFQRRIVAGLTSGAVKG
ncbi:MAG: trehalose/maltose transport system permease protein, partial [Mycobacterium sp.]|nr:trehalose/maltose transport system permease protein [Mycobacterium sp.]